MILITLFLTFAVIADIVLGITVYFTNRSRKTNQAYLASTSFMFCWLLANLLILHSTDATSAKLNIRIACFISVFIPTSFQLLRLSIKHPDHKWPALLGKCSLQLFANLVVSTLCFLPNFILDATFSNIPGSPSLAQPEYGALFVSIPLYFVASLIVLAYNVVADRKQLVGAQRLELEFLVLAGISGISLGVLGAFISIFSKSSSTVPITNAASVFTISLIVAYGITVHKILTVSALLRKATAYTLITAFLITVYYATLYSMSYVARTFALDIPYFSQLVATILTAYLLLPARKHMHTAASLLFGNDSSLNVEATVREATKIFQSVSTIDGLQQQFTKLLQRAMNSESVSILIRDGSSLRSIGSKTEPLLTIENPIITLVGQTRAAVSRDSLVRTRPSRIIRESISQLKSLNLSVVAGIFSKGDLSGAVVIGERESGRIYDKIEQDTLQLLCNQFAVALENARLYTEVQDSKIQNEIMLDQLASGVVVANPDREITLFNHEAQKTTGIGEENAIGQNIAILPREIYLALEVTLENQNGVRNIDATLSSEEEGEESLKNIRMGSAFLFGHDGKPMGAMLVFTDITELKALEEQVRRSDQLSSVGTLAAGMAHEIKNPLVTIKTFTQLLPQRYGDEDFRKDFSSLVAHEVERIDGIVNELLSFSKPAQPHLVPMNFQETLDQTLKLVHEQLAQKNIELKNKCKAQKTDILGDAKLLSQALVNLNLNAIDAIGSDGKLTIGTINCSYRFANGDSPDRATTRKCIRMQITDNGKGIERENLQKIFDPFFTSKSEGTGMGLSVAHGIISEHHGVIEVDSEVGRGTTFFIYIPLLEEGVVE